MTQTSTEPQAAIPPISLPSARPKGFEFDPSFVKIFLDGLSDETGDQVPQPVGHKLLVLMPPSPTKTISGILLPEAHADRERIASICAFVVDVGPDAYNDARRFPGGPWCQPGDWVLIRSYAGIRITLGDWELRLLNDDTIEGVVKDPRGLQRA